MIVDLLELQDVLSAACEDAGIEPGGVVVWVVDTARPPGSTPIAYLHPGGDVRDDTVQVFRAVGRARVRRFAGSAHRIALWRELPELPRAALGPMLRHELAHAVRWELSGTAFYEADEHLRAAVGGAGYPLLPTEREANAAAAAYARRVLQASELERLAASPELVDLFAAEAPADVVGETLALLGREVEVGEARLERGAERLRIELVPPAPAARSAELR